MEEKNELERQEEFANRYEVDNEEALLDGKLKGVIDTNQLLAEDHTVHIRQLEENQETLISQFSEVKEANAHMMQTLHLLLQQQASNSGASSSASSYPAPSTLATNLVGSQGLQQSVTISDGSQNTLQPLGLVAPNLVGLLSNNSAAILDGSSAQSQLAVNADSFMPATAAADSQLPVQQDNDIIGQEVEKMASQYHQEEEKLGAPVSDMVKSAVTPAFSNSLLPEEAKQLFAEVLRPSNIDGTGVKKMNKTVFTASSKQAQSGDVKLQEIQRGISGMSHAFMHLLTKFQPILDVAAKTHEEPCRDMINLLLKGVELGGHTTKLLTELRKNSVLAPVDLNAAEFKKLAVDSNDTLFGEKVEEVIKTSKENARLAKSLTPSGGKSWPAKNSNQSGKAPQAANNWASAPSGNKFSNTKNFGTNSYGNKFQGWGRNFQGKQNNFQGKQNYQNGPQNNFQFQKNFSRPHPYQKKNQQNNK